MKFEQHEIEWTSEKTARLWDHYQKTPSMAENYFGSHYAGHVTELIDKKVGLRKVKRILDLSCGPGDVISSLLPRLRSDQEIYATDFSESSVDFVNRRFQGDGPFRGATFLRGFPTPFADRSFDLIVSTEVVEHLTDDELDSMLKEANRLLSPNGYIFVTTPNTEDLALNTTMCPDCGCTFHRWQHLRSWSSSSLRSTSEEYGFKTVFVSPVAWGQTPLKRTLYRLAASIKLKVEDGLIYVGQKLT